MLELVVFMLVGSVTPGPNNALLMRSGLNFGLLRSLPHWLGIVFGFAFMLSVLALLFPHAPEWAQEWLYWLAIAFGLYISYKIASTPVGSMVAGGEQSSALQPWRFWQAAAFQWVNPKAWLLGLAVFGAFDLPPAQALSVAVICNTACVSWLVAGKLLQRLVVSDPRKERAVYLILGASMAGSLLL